MNRATVAGTVGGVVLLSMWFQFEAGRGSFDPIERPFLSWLAANTAGGKKLPPLTLVLYDEEASALAGTPKMAMLDGALFARAASKLGAVAAGVEGLSGDPARMIQAAEGMPVFGGYMADQPPGSGWSPLRGNPATTWPELDGLPGLSGRFVRGFITAPSSRSSMRTVQMLARCGDRPVPSLLLVAWAVTHGWRISEMSVGPDVVAGPGDRIKVDDTGRAMFMPEGEMSVMTMNELLVAAERFEREGGASALRDRLLVLARATPDVTRIKGDGDGPMTPMELWASAWEAVRNNRIFLPAGTWYTVVLVAGGSLLAFSPARQSNRRAMGLFFFAVAVYLLAALAIYSESRVLLPAGPTILTLATGCLLGRLGYQGGWLKK